MFKTIEDIKKYYGVKSHKETKSGLYAIRKGGYWLYFRWHSDKEGYRQTGSTDKYED